MHIISAKAICFKEALTDEFKEYQKQVVKNAKTLADTLVQQGFDLVSNGTDNHLMLVDLRNKGMTGKIAENLLDEAGITVNKNTIPYDPESPFITSGIRIGTPAVTSRGMKEPQMVEIGQLISEIISNNGVAQQIKERISKLCKDFPLYENGVS